MGPSPISTPLGTGDVRRLSREMATSTAHRHSQCTTLSSTGGQCVDVTATADSQITPTSTVPPYVVLGLNSIPFTMVLLSAFSLPLCCVCRRRLSDRQQCAAWRHIPHVLRSGLCERPARCRLAALCVAHTKTMLLCCFWGFASNTALFCGKRKYLQWRQEHEALFVYVCVRWRGRAAFTHTHTGGLLLFYLLFFFFLTGFHVVCVGQAAKQHTILLVQATSPDTRKYYDFDSVNDAMLCTSVASVWSFRVPALSLTLCVVRQSLCPCTKRSCSS